MKTSLPSTVFTVLLLAGCAASYPPQDPATRDRISAELQSAAQAPAREPPPRTTALPVPEAISASLLPPLKLALPKASAKQLEQRFDLVVSDALLSQVLTGIVEDTNFSIVMKPRNSAAAAAPERVTLKLKNVTLFETLDTVREVYGYDYQVEGHRIYVQPPELQTRLYQVNYVVGQRRGVSDLQVVGGASRGSSQASGGQGGASGTASGSGSGYASLQASALSSVAKTDLWGEVEDALRTTLGCQIARSQAGGQAAGQPGGLSAGGGTSAGSRADVSFPGEHQSGERQRGIDGCSEGRALTISPMSGTILVRAMPRELKSIEHMLRTMEVNIQRQVIIEAKIIDVELNAGAQQGVNWSAFSNGLHRFSVGSDTTLIGALNGSAGAVSGGQLAAGATLGALAGGGLVGAVGGNAFASGLGMALQLRNFSALINFLQTQGNVHVLSSPRIATLNNQKAVLKVGNEEPYVTGITAGSQATTSGVVTTAPPTLQYQPFFSGIALDVTPQIDERDNITLHVHTMVNSVVEKMKISQPSTSAVYVPFAVNTINEADSVVRTRDSQVVVIGGLMTERAQDDRDKVPGLGDVPGPGGLFSKGAQKSSKRELVILLKPTVVKDDSNWTADIRATQDRIDSLAITTPTPR